MHQSYGLQIFSDSSDIYSTKCFLFSPKCTKFVSVRPRPRWGSLQRSPRPPSWIWLGSRRAPTENFWSNPPFQNPGYGPGSSPQFLYLIISHCYTSHRISYQRQRVPPEEKDKISNCSPYVKHIKTSGFILPIAQMLCF